MAAPPSQICDPGEVQVHHTAPPLPSLNSQLSTLNSSPGNSYAYTNTDPDPDPNGHPASRDV
jgi:hypothetical protein